jgi:hypothetical protein
MYKFMHIVFLTTLCFLLLLRVGMLIGPKVIAACVIFTVKIRFTVCLSNTAAVTNSAYSTAVVTALYNDANSDIGSHHNVTERVAGKKEGSRWGQENRVSENRASNIEQE